MIARLQSLDALPHGLDNPRTFMTEHHGRLGDRAGSVQNMEVGCADSRGCDPNKNFASMRLI